MELVTRTVEKPSRRDCRFQMKLLSTWFAKILPYLAAILRRPILEVVRWIHWNWLLPSYNQMLPVQCWGWRTVFCLRRWWTQTHQEYLSARMLQELLLHMYSSSGPSEGEAHVRYVVYSSVCSVWKSGKKCTIIVRNLIKSSPFLTTSAQPVPRNGKRQWKTTSLFWVAWMP